MKKIVFILMALLPLLNFAQKKEKIKGNREVITRVYTVAPFRFLELGDDLEIRLIKTADTTQIQLKADENLHEVLKWDVNDGKLKLWLSKKIVSKKKFEITVMVPGNFEGIYLYDHARANTEEKLTFKNFYVEMHDRSKADLLLKIKDTIGIRLTNNAELKQDLDCDKLRMEIDKDGSFKGTVFAGELDVNMSDSGDIRMNGRVKNIGLKMKGHAEFGGYKTDITHNAEVDLKNKATVRLHGKGGDRIQISLTDSASLYIKGQFGDYKIKKFKGDSAIFHKD